MSEIKPVQCSSTNNNSDALVDSAQLKCRDEIFLGTVLTVFRTRLTTAITTLRRGPISTILTVWPRTNRAPLLDSCAEPDSAASDCFYGVISTAGSDRPAMWLPLLGYCVPVSNKVPCGRRHFLWCARQGSRKCSRGRLS